MSKIVYEIGTKAPIQGWFSGHSMITSDYSAFHQSFLSLIIEDCKNNIFHFQLRSWHANLARVPPPVSTNAPRRRPMDPKTDPKTGFLQQPEAVWGTVLQKRRQAPRNAFAKFPIITSQ